jgi:hypothetical protein
MGLKSMLRGSWFTRLVLISWLVCAVFIFVLFKNMELIVHGQLYSYGLRLSPDWADPYRLYTFLIYLCLGLPMALSGVALASSFLKVEKVPTKQNTIQRGMRATQSNVKVASQPVVRQVFEKVENGNGDGISCPNCNKIFGKALVMLDFRSGKNRMVSVCPYCNHVLGYTSEERDSKEEIYVTKPDEKVVR